MKCNNCGQEVEDSLKFCRYCGTKLLKDVKNNEEELQQNEESGKTPKSKKGIIVGGIILIVFILLALVFFIFILPSLKKNNTEEIIEENKTESSDNIVDEEIDDSDTDSDNSTEEEEKYSLTLTLVGANEAGAIANAGIVIKGNEDEFSGETDGTGKVTFSDLNDGEYIITCEADGYNERDISVNIDGEDKEKIIALAPEMSDGDACVLLEWDGNRDLDLYGFNAALNEAVNITNPVDSTGNVFLYADHSANAPYELIYVHDINDNNTRSFFVVDTANACNGSTSKMEEEGVTVYVYDDTGLVWSSDGDVTKNAPLWLIGYFYSGEFYAEQDYITDTTSGAYSWIEYKTKSDEDDEQTNTYSSNSNDASSDIEDWKYVYTAYIAELECEYSDLRGCLAYTEYSDIPLLFLYNGPDFLGAYSYMGEDVEEAIYGITNEGNIAYCGYEKNTGDLFVKYDYYGEIFDNGWGYTERYEIFSLGCVGYLVKGNYWLRTWDFDDGTISYAYGIGDGTNDDTWGYSDDYEDAEDGFNSMILNDCGYDRNNTIYPESQELSDLLNMLN